MVGIEYILLHVQEPILYVIRKQHRFSPTQGIKQSDIDCSLHAFILLYHMPQYTADIMLNKFLKNVVT